MKKLTVTFILLGLAVLSQAQIFEGTDGRYYADNNTLYTGSYQEYYQDGNTRMVMNLTNGVADGKMMLFYQNGTVKETRSYKSGKFDGIWTTYNNKGSESCPGQLYQQCEKRQVVNLG